jgi:glucose/arabinose dehydrogenase
MRDRLGRAVRTVLGTGRRGRPAPLLVVLGACLLARAGAAQPAPTLVPFLQGLTQPTFVTHAGDGSGRLFLLERPGRILVLRPDAATPTVYLDLRERVMSGVEQGLLGLAFHPAFPANRRFFVHYTRQPDGATVVAEYQASAVEPEVALDTETTILTVPQPSAFHNGGMIAFGPDGFLYIALGDGGPAPFDPHDRAQDPFDLLGKVLRLDVDAPDPGAAYSSPPGNPFVGTALGRPEVFALGFRNPWRFSFDPSGALLVGDVGEVSREELDEVVAGGNYGWPLLEGTVCTPKAPPDCVVPGVVPPALEYAHTGGRCAIVAGYAYRGPGGALPPGTYVLADHCSGEVMTPGPGGTLSVLGAGGPFPTSLGEDEAGELYVTTLGGDVHKLVATPALDRPSVRVQGIRLVDGAVEYAAFVVNPGDAPLGAATLAVRPPPGGVVTAVAGQPAAAQVDPASDGSQTVWTVAAVPPRTILGPFVHRVGLPTAPGRATAVLGWQLPEAGQTTGTTDGAEAATLPAGAIHMAEVPVTAVRGAAFSATLGAGTPRTLPLAGAGATRSSFWATVGGTGVRFLVPEGDRGLVTVTRVAGPCAADAATGLTELARYQVGLGQPGALLLQVPLRCAAPPLALVRVAADLGLGFGEQAVLGSVTPDGWHAVFAAEGTGTYVLGVDTAQATLGQVPLGQAAGLVGPGDLAAGLGSLFVDGYSDLLPAAQVASGLVTRLRDLGGPPVTGDPDGDGLFGPAEDAAGTDPLRLDTDGDHLGDGQELTVHGTDPRSADTDRDGVPDGVEVAAGTDPTQPDSDGDGLGDGAELRKGLDPGVPDACGGCGARTALALAPHCGSWGGCFTADGGATLYPAGRLLGLSATVAALLGLPDGSPLVVASPPPFPDTAEGASLRTLLAAVGDDVVLIVPAGQALQPRLDPPRLALSAAR